MEFLSPGFGLEQPRFFPVNWGAKQQMGRICFSFSCHSFTVSYLQLLEDFLLGLELFVWLALLIALHKYSLTRGGACRRVEGLHLAVHPFSGKTKKKGRGKVMDDLQGPG